MLMGKPQSCVSTSSTGNVKLPCSTRGLVACAGNASSMLPTPMSEMNSPAAASRFMVAYPQ